MITAAREAGDLAKQEDGRPGEASSATRLSDLGISYDLAAYSVQLAELPDEVWDAWHQGGGGARGLRDHAPL